MNGTVIDTNDRWSAWRGNDYYNSPEGKNFPEWIEIDLGSVYYIEQIDIAWFSQNLDSTINRNREYYYNVWAIEVDDGDWFRQLDRDRDFEADGYTLLTSRDQYSAVPINTSDSFDGKTKARLPSHQNFATLIRRNVCRG